MVDKIRMLSYSEEKYLLKKLGRRPNNLELDVIEAEWSEHCSYKSSKKYLQLLPTKGTRVIVGPGFDAGVLDVGHGSIITVHIESHNHPSAVEPYGGAATGVGGVIRDIISMGTRPILLLNALRFGVIGSNSESKSRWLFRNVVKGIADYGNCIGIPTVGGEIEFDRSFEDYCLVDVAAIGIGKADKIVSNSADVNDLIILVGNYTGRDGIHGASFASKLLEEDNRSAVQIPDPFLEKLLIEATIAAVEIGCIKSIKDLGGGGLACCLSELADKLNKGFEIELSSVHTKRNDLIPNEILISESQERMVFIVSKARLNDLSIILNKFGILFSIIGKVSDHRDLVFTFNGKQIGKINSHLVANAPLALRKATRPSYIDKIRNSFIDPPEQTVCEDTLISLLSNLNITSKKWVYQQYDHEVGLRTVVRPGGDASVVRINDNSFISVKLDGNSRQCYLDPYRGALSCLSEACRNVICSGASPIGIIDHLQFGDPEDPEIFWSFRKSLDAIVNYCKYMSLPVIGGKVSFYNETNRGSIKPSPVIGCIGLIENSKLITKPVPQEGNAIFVIGQTRDELGGSEYFESYRDCVGGTVPKVVMKYDKMNGSIVLNLIKKNLVDCVHDCSKGGISVALTEMAMQGNLGFDVETMSIPNKCSRFDYLMFSESNSRYIIGTKSPAKVYKLLSDEKCIFGKIGEFNGTGNIRFRNNNQIMINLDLTKATEAYHSFESFMTASSK